MKYVIDSCVAAFWVLRSPFARKALQLRDDYHQGIHDLIAPSHFPHEIASALTKSERQKLIRMGTARKLVQDVLTSSPILHAIDNPLFYRAIDLSSQTRSAFYDCIYVALGEREGCQVVTTDDQLIRNLQPQFPFIIHLSTVP